MRPLSYNNNVRDWLYHRLVSAITSFALDLHTRHRGMGHINPRHIAISYTEHRLSEEWIMDSLRGEYEMVTLTVELGSLFIRESGTCLMARLIGIGDSLTILFYKYVGSNPWVILGLELRDEDKWKDTVVNYQNRDMRWRIGCRAGLESDSGADVLGSVITCGALVMHRSSSCNHMHSVFGEEVYVSPVRLVMGVECCSYMEGLEGQEAALNTDVGEIYMDDWVVGFDTQRGQDQWGEYTQRVERVGSTRSDRLTIDVGGEGMWDGEVDDEVLNWFGCGCVRVGMREGVVVMGDVCENMDVGGLGESKECGIKMLGRGSGGQKGEKVCVSSLLNYVQALLSLQSNFEKSMTFTCYLYHETIFKELNISRNKDLVFEWIVKVVTHRFLRITYKDTLNGSESVVKDVSHFMSDS
ncbi:hypothetical protein Tco_0644720 [Tanacetum coccineum]